MKKVLIGLASAAFAVGCGGGGGTTPGGGKCAAGGGTGTLDSKLVASSVLLPAGANTYKYDFDGSGTPKNILGTLLGLLAGSGSTTGSGTPQGSVDKAVQQDGTFILLLDAHSDSFVKDDCSAIDISYATTTPNAFMGTAPALTPKAAFTVASSAGDVDGPIAGGVFSSLASATATTPATLQVNLPLLDGVPPLQLALTAVHITATYGTDGKTITGGVINGAIKNSDMRTTIFPEVAAALTQLIQQPDCSATVTTGCSQPSTKTLINTSINTGCKDPTQPGGLPGGTGTGKDNIIGLCEIKEGLVGTTLSPDLDLYSDTTTDTTVGDANVGDAVGSYGVYKPTAPDPAADSKVNKAKDDCISFGIGFSAVAATF